MKFLNLEDSKNIQYPTNYLNRVIVEVRFPVLMDWESKIPVVLVNALRKQYPFYEERDDFNFGIASMKSTKNHCFLSKDKNSLIALRPSAFILEVSGYSNFKKFLSETLELNKMIFPHLDTNLYTRVGLRYINVIPYSEQINPTYIFNNVLFNQKLPEVLGDLLEFDNKITGRIDEHNLYTLRHGINGRNAAQYILDFDYYREIVEPSLLEDSLNLWHDRSFKFFNWIISDHLKGIMNES